MHAMPNLLLTLLFALAAFGCGDSVNLGDNPEHWFDGDAVRGGSTTVPITMYEGLSPATYAVDDSTLFVTFVEGQPSGFVAVTVKSCDLASCASTVRIVSQQTYPSASAMPTPLLAVAGSEFFFQSRDSMGAQYIGACPKSGCASAPRQVGFASAPSLVATDDAIYWCSSSSINRCPREWCDMPTQRSLDAIAHAPGQSATKLSFLFVADGYAYIAGPGGVARVKGDLAADPDWIYPSELPMGGIAARGDWVYFSVAALTGQLLRCPVSGCVGDAEVMVSGQRWPSWLAVDDATLYWFNFTGDDRGESLVTLGAVAVDGSSGPRTVLSKVPLMTNRPIFMNAHHLYWMDASDGHTKIRALAK